MNANFQYRSNLQYKMHALTEKVKAFETGAKYVSMEVEFKKQLRERSQTIKQLKADLASSRRQVVHVRTSFMQVLTDLESENKRETQRHECLQKKLEERVLRAEQARDAALDTLQDMRKELYATKVELETEKEKKQKLLAQLHRDSENSSLPSSMKPNGKKTPNSREKTGRKPGGQVGHEGHKRKPFQPTMRICIPAPKEYEHSPLYIETGRIITKQKVGLKVCLKVEEYYTQEYRNIKTGVRVHAPFPKGLVNEVTYDGSIKALAFLLNNRYEVAIDKVREVMSELTEGQLQLSKGMINGLSKEFSV